MKHGKIIAVVRERQQKAYAIRMEELRNEWERKRIDQYLALAAKEALQIMEEKSRRRWWQL